MKTVKLGDICNFVNGDRGKNYPSKSKQTQEGVPFINAGHFIDGRLDMENMNYISEETFGKLGSGKIQAGDILFCLRGTLGKFATVGELQKGAIASSLVIVRPDLNKLQTEYLMYYFGSKDCAKMIEKFRNGAAQPNLSAKSLTLFEIKLPSLEEQRRIVDKLDAAFERISAAEVLMRRNLDNVAALQKSILHKYLSADDSTHTHTD